MSTPVETQTGNERRTIYIVVAVVVAILLIIGLIAFSSKKSTQQAEQKADQFIAALQAEGARTPTRDQVVRVLGDDGGAVGQQRQQDPAVESLVRVVAGRAAGPGMRPVIADSRVVKGQLLIIKIYCPDELQDFQEFVDDLKTDDVAG